MNRQFILAILAICLVLIEARLIARRERVHPKYVKLGRADPEAIHEFRIALKQRNLDILEAAVLDASNPDSPNYGKWWTTERILDLIAPSQIEVEPVLAWLRENGIHNFDASGRDFVKVRASIGQIEKIFNAQMYNYRSTETDVAVARLFGTAHIPDHLSIVEQLFGVSELVPVSSIRPQSRPIKQRSAKFTDPLGYVYPSLLRQMYGIPSTFKVNPKSSLSVVQFGFQNVAQARSFSPQDVTGFNSGMNENVHVDKFVGPYDPTRTGLEPTLDVEMASSIGLQTKFWYWTEMVWMYSFATDLFNAQDYPLVVSMSYGIPEDDQCTIDEFNCPSSGNPGYAARTDTEFMKITMKGVTLLAASGDQGAPGDDNPFCSTQTLSNIYPATSPWVTGVGATMLIPGGSVVPVKQPPACQQNQCANTTLEGACSYPTSLITSGGGFSSLNPMPSWQQAAVSQYLNSGVQLPIGYFNQSNRAFPDISANGHNFLFYFSYFQQVDGTSASTPLVAGMMALLNSYLLNNNKAPLGFINPLLYKMSASDPSTFTDITTGNNKCTMNCCSSLGYPATNGWDAVTGLGTPVFPRIQSYLMKNVVNKK